METQFAYCMDLFSDRNMVTQNAPFAVSVYLFNNKGDFVSKHYYPTSLSNMEQIDADYQELQQRYKVTGSHFKCFLDETKADLCFPLFDDEMNEMGTCIVAIQLNAIDAIFKDTAKYQSYTWVVTSNGNIIAHAGNHDYCEGIAKMANDPQI